MKYPLALICVLALLQGCGGGADPAMPRAVTPSAQVQTAPVVDTGPALETPLATLEASLKCPSDLTAATRSPVLLVHGTPYDAAGNYGWNWAPALQKLNIPYCTVDLPVKGTGELQNAAEYVVHAIRQMAARSQQKVQVVGYSMGGMLPRWALRFWPDTRAMVDDLVSLSGVNHGTLDATPVCAIPCAPAIWQLRIGSQFLQALNEGFETVPGVSYTAIYTRTDEVVVPNFTSQPTSALRASGELVTNIATQDICPLNLAEHLTIGTSDPVAYAIALDAITHPGPAQSARVSRSACAQLFMPGVDPLNFPLNFANLGAAFLTRLLLSPKVNAEPPLKCYVKGTCPPNA